MSIRDEIADEYPDLDSLFMGEEEFDVAIVGVTAATHGSDMSHRVVYDLEKVIEVNMSRGMSVEEAMEFFDFNQGGAYVGPHTTIFIRK